MTSTLIIDPLFNTPGMHDDTGAFEPHAAKLAKVLGAEATRLSFDNTLSKPVRLDDLIRRMGVRPEKNLIHLGHGWHTGCEAGLLLSDPRRTGDFLNTMPNLEKFVLLSCSTASSPIATSLAWHLMRASGLEVLAHTTEGRDAQNPNVTHIVRGGARTLPDWRGHRSPHWKAWVDYLLHQNGWVDMVCAFIKLVPVITPDWHFYTDTDGFLQWEPRTT
jgi:hypothetical protein